MVRRAASALVVAGAVLACGCGSARSDLKAVESGGSGPASGGWASGGSASGGSASGGSASGGGSDGPAGTGGAVQHFDGASNVAELCVTFPAAWGAYMARCHGGEASEWQSSISTPCGTVARSEAAGRITLHSDNAQACLASLASDDCSAPVRCNDLFTGSVPEGESCNRLSLPGGDECEPGAFCRAETLGSCGSICSPVLKLGESCAGMGNISPCAAGLSCDNNARCALPSGAKGEACTSGLCGPGSYCDARDKADPGTCRALKTEGPCKPSQCAPGLRCIGEGEPQCVPARPVGARCTFGSIECAGQCSLDGQCEVASQEGEPCGQILDPLTSKYGNLACAGDLFCDNQVCHRRLEVGERCTFGAGTKPCADVGESLASCHEGKCTRCE